VASVLWLRLAGIIQSMTDPWVVLSRTLDVIEAAGLAYLVYQNRDLLLRRQRPPIYISVSGSSAGSSSARATATVLKGLESDELVGTLKALPGNVTAKLKGLDTEELVGTLTAIPPKAPPSLADAVEELFWWYWRVR
jgi:hypothetical protein